MKKDWSILDLSVVRTPLFPLSFYISKLSLETNPENIINLVLNNQVIKEAIYFANPNLLNELKKYNNKSDKKKRNIITSLYKYLARISTKSTPFGLFSGVQEVSQKNTSYTSLNNQTEKKNNKYIRVDSMWLLGVIEKIEVQEQLWDFINVKFVDMYLFEGDRIFFPYKTMYGQFDRYKEQGEKNGFSIRNSELINKIRLIATDFIPLSVLLFELKNIYTDFNVTEIKSYLKQLISLEILHTNLRPNLTNANSLDDLLLFFKRNNLADQPMCQLLYKIQECISEYSDLELGKFESIELLNEIKVKMEDLYKCKDYLHIDLKFESDYELPRNCNEDIKKAIDILSLFLIHRNHNHNQSLETFKKVFIEKYGYNTEIKLVELLYSLEITDYTTKNITTRTLDEVEDHTIYNYMESLITNALFQGFEELEITDNEIIKFKQYQKIDFSYVNESFDMLFSIVKNNDLVYLTVNNDNFSDNAGQLIGRFFPLLSDKYIKEIEILNDFEKSIYGDNYEIAEVGCQSVYGRASNISSTINPRDHELPILSGFSKLKNNIKIGSILSGINDYGELYLKNSDTNNLIVPKTTNMLNGVNYFPEVYKFLLDVGKEGEIPFQTFFPIFYNKFVFTPRIRYKNIVLSKKQWRIDMYILQLEKQFKYEDWEYAISKWRETYKVPRIVEMKNLDSTIYFNLENSLHLKILRKEFSKLNKLIFTEVDYGIDINSIKENQFKEELTVSILNKRSIKKKFNTMHNNPEIKRKIIPGDDWIYYKLYIKEDYQDELLIKSVLPSMNKLLKENKIYSYFYVRYIDSRPHIRLRIKVDSTNFNFVFSFMYDWIKKYIEENFIDSLSIDTYYPEYMRYGGQRLEERFHEVFFADSQYCLELLNLNNKIGEPIEKIIIFSVKCLLQDIGFEKDKQIKLINQYLDLHRLNKKILKLSFKDYILENSGIDDSNFESEEFSKFRACVLKQFSKELEIAQLEGFDMNDIVLSVIHMNVNRLMIIYREKENQLMYSVLKFLEKN
ncbi:lantibiotic dehydratase [Lysinibacillus sp. NPDC096212]|uniref:lantibiotic dehydratase n=1 Tax=Lysinibacillus sp. NPDC096212 TaxID=3364135 RepID=UPI00380BE9B5